MIAVSLTLKTIPSQISRYVTMQLFTYWPPILFPDLCFPPPPCRRNLMAPADDVRAPSTLPRKIASKSIVFHLSIVMPFIARTTELASLVEMIWAKRETRYVGLD
jgi:hypothetical protein